MTATAEHMARIGEAAALRKVLRTEDRQRLRDGLVTVPELLPTPQWQNCTVMQLLQAQYRWGPDRAARLVTQVPCSERKLCGELTARQRAKIAELLEARS